MSNIAAKLDKLETIFKEANAPILQHFNPGLPEKEINVPILSGGEDDMHVLKTSTGAIYYSSPGIQVFCDEVAFSSLSYMLDFIIECFQDGSLRMHPQEGLIDSREYWKKLGVE